jgi:cytoskeleton protein RodZ
MGSFGDRLRREREMRGITLDEIAESTKISRKNLESLEKEDFDSLPGGIFNKGFVRAYARYLGIDEDQAVADYASNSHEAPPPEDQFPLEIHEKPDRKLNPRVPRWPLIGAVAAIMVIGIGYTVWAKKGRQHETAGTVSAAEPATAATGAASKGTSKAPSTTPSSEPAAEPPAKADTAATAPAPVKQTPLVKEVASTVVAAKTAAPAASPAVRVKPQPPERTFFIVIKAKEDAWISVVADGRQVAHGTLRADKQKLVKAGRKIIVTTGNAGGLELSYNGKPLGVIGNESEARTLTFTPTGLAD